MTQLNDEEFVKAAQDTVRILIRRPHAYKFARAHPGSQIPGIVLLNTKGKVLAASARIPVRGGVDALVDVLDN